MLGWRTEGTWYVALKYLCLDLQLIFQGRKNQRTNPSKYSKRWQWRQADIRYIYWTLTKLGPTSGLPCVTRVGRWRQLSSGQQATPRPGWRPSGGCRARPRVWGVDTCSWRRHTGCPHHAGSATRCWEAGGGRFREPLTPVFQVTPGRDSSVRSAK